MSKLKELEKRLKDEPENLGLRVMVAGAMREAGRQEEAVELYRSVAIAYRDQGRSQQAIAVCRSVLEIAPDDTRFHALLASLVASNEGRAAHGTGDTGGSYGEEIVLEVGTPPPPPERSKPASIPPLVSPPAPGGAGMRTPTSPPPTSEPASSMRTPTSPPTSSGLRTPPPSSTGGPPSTSGGPTPPPSNTGLRTPSPSTSGGPPSTSGEQTPPPSSTGGPTPPPSNTGLRTPSPAMGGARAPTAPPAIGRTPSPAPPSTSGGRTPTAPPAIGRTASPAPPSTSGGRTPTAPPPATGRTPSPSTSGARAPAAPPATARAGVTVPLPAPRQTPAPRSSNRLDETPLPVPMPYHVADPTTKSLKKLSEIDLIGTPDPDDLPVSEDAKTRPGEDAPKRAEGSGLSKAARRISSALIAPLPGATPPDLSLELDTRQRPRIESDELERISRPPPTVPVERLELVGDDVGDDDGDDDETAPPSITRNMRTQSRSTPDPDDDTEQEEEEDEGIPTLSDEDHDEPTRPRDTALDLMIRTENEGPLGSAFFQPLPAEHRRAVLDRFHKKSVKKGTTVIRQGEVGHSLVVVVRGQLAARVDRKGGAVELGAVGTGEFVGEGSLLARTPSPVLITATTDCELLLLTPRDFYEIAGAFPALWAELKDVAERRKRELELHLKKT